MGFLRKVTRQEIPTDCRPGVHSQSRYHIRVAGAFLWPILATALLGFGCDSSGTRQQTSSGVFIAPLVPDGSGARNENVEALVTRLDILRVINPDKLESELIGLQAETTVMGKVTESEAVLYEKRSSSILQMDLVSGALKLSFSTEDLSAVFRTPKANIIMSVPLENGSIFGFESSSVSKSLFILRKDSATGDLDIKVLANSVSISSQIRSQTFNFVSAYELPRTSNQPPTTSEVLLFSSKGSLDELHLFIIEEVDGEVSGRFRLFDADGNPFYDPEDPNRILDPDEISPFEEVFGYITFDSIRQHTGFFDVDIFDFEPISVPESQPDRSRFLLFDKTSATFLEITVLWSDINGVVGREVDLFTARGEIDLASTFASAFFHPTAPLILSFERGSTNLVQIDYEADFGERVGVYSTANQFSRRRGGTTDAEFPTPGAATGANRIFLSDGDVKDSRVFFDQGSGEIIGLSYSTSEYVVVTTQDVLTRETGFQGNSSYQFIETVTDNDMSLFDTPGNSYLKIHLEYVAFPLRVGR